MAEYSVKYDDSKYLPRIKCPCGCYANITLLPTFEKTKSAIEEVYEKLKNKQSTIGILLLDKEEMLLDTVNDLWQAIKKDLGNGNEN